MAMHSPAPAHWQRDDAGDRVPGTAEGWPDRLATWVMVYLAALTSCLALVGGAWAAGLVG